MTPRRWWGIVCAAGAVLCFAMAGAYCTACTPAQEATADKDLTKLLGYENTLCLAANFLPGVARADAILGCQIGEGLTSAADELLRVIEARRLDSGIDAANALVDAIQQLDTMTGKDAGGQ